jgi:hypothetical protein
MLSLAFQTDNAAFENPEESGRILRHIATQIEAGIVSGIIQDYNGNKIGSYSLEIDPDIGA